MLDAETVVSHNGLSGVVRQPGQECAMNGYGAPALEVDQQDEGIRPEGDKEEWCSAS